MSVTGCPCGSGLPYGQCCRPLHEGQAGATPEALMRSPFSAFALGLDDYLFRTWHPATRPPLPYTDGTQWVRLAIVDAPDLGEQRGIVEFTAHWRTPNGSHGQMTERSVFERRAGRWVYMNGVPGLGGKPEKEESR